MVKRKRQRQRRQSVHPPRTHHLYPKGWQKKDWFVPFEDGEHACIHHGHDTDPDDHSRCGPAIFCCSKAADLYIDLFPESAEAQADWQITRAAHIRTWMDAGVNVLYFVFCDPLRPDGLLATGLLGKHARQVLFRRVPLEQYINDADRLR